MRSVKYLKDFQQAKNLTVTEAAKALGITQGAMSNLLAGRRVMENETAVAIALALNIDPMQIIMAADMDKAERNGQKSLWEVFMSRMAAPASVVLAVGATFFVSPQNAEAAPRLAGSDAGGAMSLSYVKSMVRRIARALAALVLSPRPTLS